MTMHCFIYASSATNALRAEDMTAISEACGRNNARDDLTGVLLYADRAFLQILQGSKPELAAAIDRIKMDTRHRGLAVLHNRAITGRLFEDWIVACASSRETNLSEFPQIHSPQAVFDRAVGEPTSEIDVFVRTFYNSIDGRTGEAR